MGDALAPGLDPSSPYSRHIVARFSDFVNPAAPWPRRLWDIGTFLALEEIYEAGIWLDRHVLSATTISWLRHNLTFHLGRDTAFGTPPIRRQLTQCLGSDLSLHSDGRRRLRYLIDMARPEYLDRLAEEVASDDPPGPERTARATASHLLDSGYSSATLRRWFEGKAGLSAAELLSEAASLDHTPPQLFHIWVSCTGLPKVHELDNPLPNFCFHSDLPQTLADHLQQQARRPLIGAFSYSIQARDADRAVEVVADVLERIRARTRFAGLYGERVFTAEYAFVESEHRFVKIHIPDRGAEIMSLVAGGQLLAVDAAEAFEAQRHALDDALDLAAPVNSGSVAPAITGAWAALEALLTDAQDTDQTEGKVAAATRAARLAACSWPRAELTALSYNVDSKGPGGTALARSLSTAPTNRDRAELVAIYLQQSHGLPLKRSWRLQGDVAAVSRMNKLIANPSQQLTEVSGYIEASFRRMYRCRNVIIHGGSTRSDVLERTLRVVAPLVGATLDRLAHAYLALSIEPLKLATRADMAIQLASDPVMGFKLVDLLGNQ